jgi:sialate O-acetylesterase
MYRYVLLCLALVTSSCFADVRLPKVLGSGMVLQRNSRIQIWGWADVGEQVTLKCSWLDEQQHATTNGNGQWSVELATAKAGGPHRITIVGQNEIALDDILFGEVWLASGQSNMEMPLVKVSGAYTGINDSSKEVESANYPEIRLFQVGNFSSKESLDDVERGISMYGIPPSDCQWQACTPETIPHFASTAYFFARKLHTELTVPIGIIDASWGGTSAEAWTPADGLKQLGYDAELEQAVTAQQNPSQKVPTRLYNGMIHPLRNFKIKGAIWYQGEGNAGRADKYRDLFSTMIRQWRAVFGYEFPFYFVQISPFNYNGINAAFLREAQLETKSVEKTGMVVTMDIGNLTDIHPKNKQEVGRRLALRALAMDYGREIVYSGPVYRDVRFQDGKAFLSFDQIGGGLSTANDQPPSHFTVAGNDKKFQPAQAVIDGDMVIVSSAAVPEPTAVRYGFSNDAQPNLINQAGLPASSFRSDRW